MHISGGQARAAPLMRLLADVCSLPVVIPVDAQAAVVRGAAILGRFAAEATARGAKCGEEAGELLWKIMVSGWSVHLELPVFFNAAHRLR
jgi:ribulose kinase